jgi:hypothetical protein
MLGAAIVQSEKPQQFVNIAHRLGEVAAGSPDGQGFDEIRMTGRSLAASV